MRLEDEPRADDIWRDELAYAPMTAAFDVVRRLPREVLWPTSCVRTARGDNGKIESAHCAAPLRVLTENSPFGDQAI